MAEEGGLKRLRGVRVLAAINGLELFGHERGNIEVLKALRRQGAEVRVGVNAMDEGGAVGMELSNLGFRTFHVPFGNQWSWQWLKREPLSVFGKAGAVWRSSATFSEQLAEFRATHVHLGSTLAWSYLSLALARTRVPLVFRMGDCPPVDSRFNLRIWRMAMRRATSVVAISEFVRLSAIRAGVSPDRVSRIYNLAPSPATPARKQGEPRAGLGNAGPRIVYVGAVAEHKGLIPLVDAFATVARTLPGLVLDVVGGSRYDADFRSVLLSRIEALGLGRAVVLHGHVEDPAPFYANASVHVAPSLWDEPLGNVVLEAKREGIPSVVFPAGGLPEMVRHGVDGFICQQRSAESLQQALLWMLQDRRRLTAMGRSARDDYVARFDEARFSDQWAGVYRSTPRK